MMNARLCVGFVVMLFASAAAAQPQEPITADPPLRWWKGNLHTHTLWSDGDDFPEMVAEWYRDHDYHFLALSDHNILSQAEKWMRLADIEKRGGKIALEKYQERFGPDWVELRGEGTADSPRVIRLKPFNEYRALVEERGRFLMIQSEEISDAIGEVPIHINAANIAEVIKPASGKTVVEVIENNFRAINEQARRLGIEVLAHLNHPNFRWAVTAEDLAHAVSDQFFEVFNGHPSVHQTGDATHVSIDRMWDIANAIRMIKMSAQPLFGLATDDSHHYHFGGSTRSTPGRGWVMVRSRNLTPESIIRALKAGDFYASTGVTLRDVSFDPATRELSIEIEPDGDATFITEFVGTPTNADITGRPVPTTQRVTQVYSTEVGKTFAAVEGLAPKYKLMGEELYVRAIVTSSAAHANPTWEGQKKQAWTQPVGWRK
jgi:hypothetical protein